METKTLVQLKVVKNDREYTLSLPLGAPYGEAYDAAFEMLGKILELADDAKKRVEQQKEKEE